ncbi:endocuticle structural glycoprotein SgAbd-5-like [Galleria mellonella]|uniref:Endocuticle structural glycoprotein SgAbd-5-like n=1 Tax=Galleria mellonella TaxID=7137 RepID=A0A6J3C9Z7_GALME|nr:endocuticle structural glycoprotein SgAbd-5-like [Galleria mellonella]
MKLLVLLVLLGVAAVAPAPQSQNQNEPEVQLLRFESDNDGLGTYSYSFEQSDKTQREEQGELKNAGTDNEAISIKGSYSWVAPDGVVYKITYIADENGFQPKIEKTPSTSA